MTKSVPIALCVVLLAIDGLCHSYLRTEEPQLVAEEKDPAVEDVPYVKKDEVKDEIVFDLRNGSEISQKDEERVSYAGSQLWKVFIDNDDKKITVAKLKEGECKYMHTCY